MMAIYERTREIGMLLALGMRPAAIRAEIVIESGMLLLVGLVLGNGLGIASVRQVSDGIDLSVVAEGMASFGAGSTLYPQLLVRDVVITNIIVLVLGFLASLWPAWRASRHEPVEALTHT